MLPVFGLKPLFFRKGVSFTRISSYLKDIKTSKTRVFIPCNRYGTSVVLLWLKFKKIIKVIYFINKFFWLTVCVCTLHLDGNSELHVARVVDMMMVWAKKFTFSKFKNYEWVFFLSFFPRCFLKNGNIFSLYM